MGSEMAESDTRRPTDNDFTDHSSWDWLHNRKSHHVVALSVALALDASTFPTFRPFALRLTSSPQESRLSAIKKRQNTKNELRSLCASLPQDPTNRRNRASRIHEQRVGNDCPPRQSGRIRRIQHDGGCIQQRLRDQFPHGLLVGADGSGGVHVRHTKFRKHRRRHNILLHPVRMRSRVDRRLQYSRFGPLRRSNIHDHAVRPRSHLDRCGRCAILWRVRRNWRIRVEHRRVRHWNLHGAILAGIDPSANILLLDLLRRAASGDRLRARLAARLRAIWHAHIHGARVAVRPDGRHLGYLRHRHQQRLVHHHPEPVGGVYGVDKSDCLGLQHGGGDDIVGAREELVFRSKHRHNRVWSGEPHHVHRDSKPSRLQVPVKYCYIFANKYLDRIDANPAWRKRPTTRHRHAIQHSNHLLRDWIGYLHLGMVRLSSNYRHLPCHCDIQRLCYHPRDHEQRGGCDMIKIVHCTPPGPLTLCFDIFELLPSRALRSHREYTIKQSIIHYAVS